jgi:hypothetical protein
MKIGEAHRTQSSSLYSANTIGATNAPCAKTNGGPNPKQKIRET